MSKQNQQYSPKFGYGQQAAGSSSQQSSDQQQQNQQPQQPQQQLSSTNATLSTPSNQSARSSQISQTSSQKAAAGTRVVTVNLAQNSSRSKGKKSKQGAGRKRTMVNNYTKDQSDVVTNTTHTSSSNASIEMTPQRSRSEAPNENSIGNVLYEVHKKLMNRGRKLSPAKLQAKQQERQQRAEHLRAKIELSRKEWCKKVTSRQQLARARQQETVERKRLNLQDRLEQAARNKEAELQNVVEKAKAENEKAEETNFIIKLTKQNNKLDLNNKLSENEERRKLHLSKDMARIKGQGLKREAAIKRKEELSEEMRFKVLSKEQKRDQAEQRRKEQQIAEKNKAIAEKMKRDLVRARKHVKGRKISDIMSFVSNKESLWQFIGMEQDLDSMGLQFNLGDSEALNALDEEGEGVRNLNENELLSMIQQDQFELEKLMLKRDHEILSACIIEQADGSIKITKCPMTLLNRGGPKSSSSGNSVDSSEEKKDFGRVPNTIQNRSGAINNNSNATGTFQLHPTAAQLEDPKYFSPKKQSSATSSSLNTTEQNVAASVVVGKTTGPGGSNKLPLLKLKHSQSFNSNLSSTNQTISIKSKDEIMTQDEEEERKAVSHHVSELSKSAHTGKDDDKLDYKINQQRVKVAMRRNILKRNLSEDLVWAAELQSNPNFDMVRFMGREMQHSQNLQQLETRSQGSSLERNSFDDIDEDFRSNLNQNDTNETPPKGSGKIGKTSVAHLSKRNKNKAKHQSSKSSLNGSGPVNLQGISGVSKDLNPLMNSSRGKRNSIQDLQQSFQTKQKKTLSNQGSCSSLSSLIKTKQKQEENEEYGDAKSGQAKPQGSSLNQAQLEQLGPIVKMTINGFPLSQNVPPSVSQQTTQIVTNNISNGGGGGADVDSSNAQVDHQFEDHMSASIFSSSTATGVSFQMNSLIMSQRLLPSKGALSSVQYMSSNLSKNANLYIFPIREQKIILMYKEQQTEFHFVQAQINLKLEEVTLEETAQLQIASTASTVQQNNISSNLLSTPQQSQNQQSKRGSITDQADSSSTLVNASPKTPQKSQGKQNHLEETKKTPTKSANNRTSTSGSGKKERNSTNKTSIVDLSEPAMPLLDTMEEEQDSGYTSQSDRMVNLIVKKLLVDQMQHIRIDDSQKSILFDNNPDSQAVLKYLEVNELKFKYCRLCEVAIYSEYSASSDAMEAKASWAITQHFQSKTHIRKREGYSIKEVDDLNYSLLVFKSQPGEIEVELRKENEKALKRKFKRIKMSMQSLAVSHENASTYPGKELKSSNKNRLQIRCIELQKSVFPDIKFDTVDAILNDVIKVMEKRGAGDLHLMRKLKFVPTMVDMICKRITTCPRAKLANLAKVINLVIKILAKFCSLRENRNYMIQTNRVMPLIDLLSWCLNRQTELFFGIEFMPGLFQTITTHLKHRVPFECQLLKEQMVDLLICSQIPAKLKNKLAIVKSIQSNEDENSLGQVPFFLLKSVAFLEALTAMISIDARTRPVYEKSFKIGEHVFFVLQSTELLGITQMITTLLLTCNETFKASAPSSASVMVLPQTFLSLTIMSIKVLNNMMRMDVGIVQHMMLDLNEQLYHLLNFILSYTETNIDASDDVKELLHETLIFIGYFCLLNEGNQRMLHRGENSILQKLCNLPFTYFMDKRLKEILFPTLVTVSYLNERSVAIMDQEMNMNEILVKYLETNIVIELPRIMEQEQEYFSDHTKSMSSFGRGETQSQRSSGSNSNQSVQMDFLSGNNPYLPLVMRFPKNLWKDAAQYYKSKAD